MRYFTAAGEDRRLDATTRRDLRGSFVGLSDGVTHYELAGPADGEVAVLLGGLTVPLFYWDDLAERLHARGLRTLAYSAYGRGYSDRVWAAYDEALFVRQLAELIEFCDLDRPVHLVGTSMGALIAMSYVVGYGASTLTLAGPAGLGSPQALRDLALRSDRVAEFVAKRFGRRLLQGHLGHNVRDPERAADLAAMVLDAYRYEGSMYAFFSTLKNFPLTGRAELFGRTPTAGVPTMLLWGTEDRVTPIDRMDEACALLRPVERHRIAECGHMVPFERPGDLADLLASFARRHARKGLGS